MRLRFRLSLLSAILVATPLAAQRGTLVGTVTEKGNGAPIPSASIVIAGTSRGTQTGADGKYRLPGVPAGTYQIRVLRLGFQPESQSVTLADGGTATVDFTLSPSAVTLDQVIVSASGEQQRQRETGNTVATITPDSVAAGATANLTDMLNSRAAGVQIEQQSGTTGGGSKIRIRGASSVSLTNDPLIVIDGNRVDATSSSGSSNMSTGGQSPSRLDDINPDEIENIQVLKGPAASALYGTAGANGVIQITTRHGAAGKTKWNGHAEYGSVRDRNTYPANYNISGIALDGSGAPIAGDTLSGPNCFLSTTGQPGGCNPIASSLQSFTPFNALTPFVSGWREGYGLNAGGGTEKITYFLSADDYLEQGVYANNQDRRTNLRANFHSNLASSLDVGVNVGYLQSRLKLPQNDNSFFGVLGLGLLGNAQDDPTGRGYFAGITPGDAAKLLANQDVDRFTTSGELNYHPTNWFTGVATGGLDFEDRFDNNFLPPNILPGSSATGIASPAPFTVYNYTVNLSGIFKFPLTESLHSTTTLGTQFVDEVQRGVISTSVGVVPGTGNLEGATSQFTTTQADSEIVTFGGFGQEELSWRDKMFVTAALRGDENSAFGTRNNLVYYPAFSGSWVMGEEPWFPKTHGVVSSFRLRTAYGQSGQRPAFRQAETFYNAIGVRKSPGGDLAGLTLAGIGLNTLKPEISRELEGGADVGFLKDRVNVQFTYYDKTTTNALVQVPEAPSVCGFNLPGPNAGTCVIFQNLGKVNNHGIELGITGLIVDSRPIRAEMTINGSQNFNKLDNLGLASPVIVQTGIDGVVQEHISGQPLGVFTSVPYTYKDVNHDGIIEQNEVTLGSKPVFIGTPFPVGEWTFSPSVTFFRLVKVNTTFDRRYGSKTLNFTEEFRCFSSFNCRGMYDKTASLFEQARVTAAEIGTDYGFIEDNAFWKWRELSVTLIAPEFMLRKTHLANLSLELSGRNLATWTKYTGYDPETNFAGTGSNFTTADFTTQPQVRYYTMRVNIGY